MDITRKDEYLISNACVQARLSPCLHKHGCVASMNGKIIARGYNNYDVCSKDPFGKQECSCHAEMDTLRRIYRYNHIKVV
jgi:deoxycytidylate deaminase